MPSKTIQTMADNYIHTISCTLCIADVLHTPEKTVALETVSPLRIIAKSKSIISIDIGQGERKTLSFRPEYQKSRKLQCSKYHVMFVLCTS